MIGFGEYSHVWNYRGEDGKFSENHKQGGYNSQGVAKFSGKNAKIAKKTHENERIRGHFRKIAVLDSSKISKSQTGGL